MRSLFKYGLLCGVALLAFSSRAIAQVHAEFNVGDGFVADGQWHVLVQEVGNTNTYDVFYQATQGAIPPVDAANTVNVTFFDGSHHKIGTTAGQIGLFPAGDAVLFQASAGTPLPYYQGNIAEDLWTPVAGSFTNGVAKWQESSLLLDPSGSNWVEGQVHLAAAPSSVKATVQDDTVWQASAQLSPEPGSLTLLVSALVPVGLLLRRRKAAASVTPV